MRQYERNGVIIDQCVGCGGIFLDRGELERLSQAEANYYNPGAAEPLPPRPAYIEDDARRDAPRSRDYHDDDDRYSAQRGSRKSAKRRKRESFFSELLDILD